MPDRDRAARRPGPPARLDHLDTAPSPVLRETAGVPPRGFEPLISTLKGWRPRPLDDGGESRPSVARARLDGRGGGAQAGGAWRSRNRITAAAKHAAATSADSPPTIACPKARASRPPTLERHVARAPTPAIAPKTIPSTTAPEASNGIWLG